MDARFSILDVCERLVNREKTMWRRAARLKGGSSMLKEILRC